MRRSILGRIVVTVGMAAAATMLWSAAMPTAATAVPAGAPKATTVQRVTYPPLILQGKITKKIPWSRLPRSVLWDGTKAGNINPTLRAKYRGQTLYKLIGLVDDKRSGFNVAKARKGYRIQFICKDGYKRTIKSRSIIGKTRYIIARLKNGKPLPSGEGPYRYVGGFIKPFYGKDSARMIVRIRLIF